MAEAKTCTKCGEVKALGEFDNYGRARDGKCPACKRCRKEERRRYLERNPDYFVKYNAEHKDKRRDLYKSYYRANSDVIKARSKDYRLNNRQKCDEYFSSYYSKNKNHLKSYQDKHRDVLSDYYVANVLGIPKDIAKPIIPAKREQLRNLRLAKQKGPIE